MVRNRNFLNYYILYQLKLHSNQLQIKFVDYFEVVMLSKISLIFCSLIYNLIISTEID